MSNSMINIKIYFFASIREKLGKKEISYQLEKDSSVSQLLHLLKIKFNLVGVNDCMVAVDMEYVENGAIILSKVNTLRQEQMLGTKISHITMLPEESIQIKNSYDLWLVNKIMSDWNNSQ